MGTPALRATHKNTTVFGTESIYERQDVTTTSGESERKSLNGYARIRPKIDQQPKFALRHSQIVKNLPAVLVCQCTHRLEFKDYLSEAKDIRNVLLLHASQIDEAANPVAFSCDFVSDFVSRNVSVAKRLGNAVSFCVSAEGPVAGASTKYLQEPRI